jgi:hypothetical protein
MIWALNNNISWRVEDVMSELSGALHVKDAMVGGALQSPVRTRNSYALDAIMPFYSDSCPFPHQR